jgi:phosphotransferase system  glucose/maltose/N-acetylglucosamine-specific IIC component
VLTQGYLLVGGSLPFAYPWLFGMAAVLAAVVAAIAYHTEHRIGRKRSKRRT